MFESNKSHLILYSFLFKIFSPENPEITAINSNTHIPEYINRS